VQGLLELADLALRGRRLLASSVSMDKEMMNVSAWNGCCRL